MTCFGVELDETRNDSKRFFRGHVPSTFEDTRIAIHEKIKTLLSQPYIRGVYGVYVYT